MPTYPLAMPTTGVASSDFELVHNQALNETRDGGTFGTFLAPSYWQVDMATTNVSSRSDRYAMWRAFLDAARGILKTMLLYDPDRPFPRHYKNLNGLVKAGTATPFVGEALVYAAISDRFNASINGLPANFQLSKTDYVSFVQGGRYSLHRLVDDVTANSSGVAIVTVEPSIPTFIAINAVANFARAKGEFILVQNSVRAPRGLEAAPISFSARSRAL